MSVISRWWQARTRRQRWTFRATLFGLVVYAGFQIWAGVEAERNFREALAATERGDIVTARELLAECVRQDPSSGRFLFHSGRAARREDDFRSAEKYYKWAKEAGWPAEAIEWERTLLQAQTGQFKTLEPRLRTAIEADPDHPDADLIREVLVPGYMNGFELGSAYQVLSDWMTKRPSDLRPRLLMFDVARRIMIPQDAIRVAREAVTIAPDHPQARRNCGDILIENHQAAEAKPHFEWLLARYPNDTAAMLGMVKCLREEGDFEGAIRLSTELLLADSERPEFLTERGYAELQAGRPAAAREWLRRAAEAAPSNPYIVYNYAVCLEQCGEPEEAKRWRERHARADADLLELKDVVRKVSSEPSNADLRFRAGELMMRNGFENEGLRWFRSALVVNPRHKESRQAIENYFELVKREVGDVNLSTVNARP